MAVGPCNRGWEAPLCSSDAPHPRLVPPSAPVPVGDRPGRGDFTQRRQQAWQPTERLSLVLFLLDFRVVRGAGGRFPRHLASTRRSGAFAALATPTRRSRDFVTPARSVLRAIWLHGASGPPLGPCTRGEPNSRAAFARSGCQPDGNVFHTPARPAPGAFAAWVDGLCTSGRPLHVHRRRERRGLCTRALPRRFIRPDRRAVASRSLNCLCKNSSGHAPLQRSPSESRRPPAIARSGVNNMARAAKGPSTTCPATTAHQHSSDGDPQVTRIPGSLLG